MAFEIDTIFAHIASVNFKWSSVLALAACCVFSHAVAGTSAAGRGVQILESNGSGVTISYVPTYTAPTSVDVNGKAYTRYNFDGASLPSKITAGEPELLERSIVLQFPGSQHNTIQIVNYEYEDIKNALVAPYPKYRNSGAAKNNKHAIAYTPVYEATGKSYSSSGYLPNESAYLSAIGETRGVYLGSLRIRPLQYNAASRTLRRATRIVVRVNFGESMPVHSRPDAMTSGVALNAGRFGNAIATTRSFRKVTAVHSVLASGDWYKIPITADGIYKITGQALLSAGIPANTDPATIKIFGNGGADPSLDPTAPSLDDLEQNAVSVSDVTNPHQLDATDYIVFYGKGTRGWTYDPILKIYSHYISHFTETNYYWLTYGGSPSKKMAVSIAAGSPTVFPATGTGLYFRKDEKINLLGSGTEWLGQSFGVNQNLTYVQPLPGLDFSLPINYRMSLGAQSSDYSTFTVSEHHSQLASVTFYPVAIGDYSIQLDLEPSNASAIPAQIANFPDEQSQLTFSFESNSPTGLGFIDSYEIAYQHFFRAQGDLLTFHTADTNATARYVSTGFTGGQITAYDVTRFDSVTTIGNATLASDTCSFNLTLQAGSPHEIYVVGQNGYQIAGSLTHIPNQDIHGDTTTAVNIIIAYPDFLPAAQRLKAFHDAPGPEYAPTLVLDVNQVYNEFGGGLPSTGAIRNCLRYLFARGAGDTLTTPRYALFLGDGDYDPKRVIGTGPEWIPAWETVDSFDPLLSYATEDSFAIFDGSGRMSLGVGRLPAQSLDDANTMVDKIIEYARSPIIDPWKVRTTFVADDGPADPGVNDGFIHTDDAEGISQLVPLLFNEVKIYEYAYPTVITSEGRKKPLVNQAIDNQINDGTLILNFNGHGNPRLWTHEGVFVRETDFPLLHNKGKYFFLVAATCNYSYFDEVGDQSGGELLVLMKNAGAIAVVSATRAVYEGLNYELNAALYSNNLFQTSGSSLVRQTFGDVMYRTKQIRTDDNDRKYLLIGDPALHIAFPTMYASVDSVSHISAVGPVQLKALSSANVYATVTNAPGISGASIDGNAIVEVYDADKSVQISDVLQYGSQSVPITDSFSIAGDVLFRGQETAANGIISANFVVPKDISYTNNPGKVTIYFSNSALDGAGYTRNVLIGGTDSSAAKDTQGPTVQLYLNSRTFHSGDIVGTNPVLIADLQDEHGINTSGAGVGHRLEAWLDNATESTDLSNYYQSKAGDYRQGTIQYPYSGLTEGTHKLRLRAWDTYDNPTTGETVFSVVSSSGLQLSNVFNYPNPFSHGTIFTFTHNELGSLNVEVKVYTVAGRLIRTLEATSGSAHGNTVQVPWDGRDRDGSAIANGTYLYKIIAHTTDSRFNAEALGKLTVLK